MLTPLTYGLAVAVDLFALFLGARFLLQPASAATGYGVPAAPNAYLTVKGLRDGSLGILGLVLLAFVGSRSAAWFMLVVALNPLGDTLVVLRNGGTKAVAFGIHFSTAVVILLCAALLFAL